MSAETVLLIRPIITLKDFFPKLKDGSYFKKKIH